MIAFGVVARFTWDGRVRLQLPDLGAGLLIQQEQIALAYSAQGLV